MTEASSQAMAVTVLLPMWTYVGQTGRTLSHRIKEHQQAFRSTKSSNSAVAEHAISSGHTIAWDEASVQGLSEGVDLWPKLSNPEVKSICSFAGSRLTFL